MSSTSAAKPAAEFVDTNVLVYSYDQSAGRKRDLALQLLDCLWIGRQGCLSLQVLQEFYVSVTGRLRALLSPAEAAAKVVGFSEWTVHAPRRDDLLAALELHQRHRVSFWDAMILQSARRMGCEVLWTEGLNDGQTYDGVTVRNPFRGEPCRDGT